MSDFNHTYNCAVWFDIPVVDLDRAIEFYSKVLNIKISKETYGDFSFGLLEHNQGNGGCLVPQPKEISPTKGVQLYLNVNGRIKEALKEVARLGGKVVEDLHSIGPHGYRAMIQDSEGNYMVLHATAEH